MGLRSSRSLLTCAVCMQLSACELPNVVGIQTTGDDTQPEDSESSDSVAPILDINLGDCAPPLAVSCDADSDDPLAAIGLDCLGGTPASSAITADEDAIAVHEGPIGPYEVREGEKILIMSTGRATHVALTPQQLALVCNDDPDYCPNTDHEMEPSGLPAPLDVNPVGEDETCVDNPALIGTGDCSNSLFEQWSACGGGCAVWDYAELRVGLTVPEHTYGLAFDFAFMSVEWPQFVGGGFNDMFVAWLESENWTGNVSFDNMGNPITVNAGFTDYTGDDLEGFAMAGHAGTRWLTTAFGLMPGENVQLVLAVFDLIDADHDSVVFLDDFRWTCNSDQPTTEPVP